MVKEMVTGLDWKERGGGQEGLGPLSTGGGVEGLSAISLSCRRRSHLRTQLNKRNRLKEGSGGPKLRTTKKCAGLQLKERAKRWGVKLNGVSFLTFKR